MAVLAGDSDLLRKLTESTSPLNAESINKQIGDCHNTLMLDACRGGNKVIVDRLASKVCLIVYKPQPLSREHLWNSGSLNLIMFNTYLYNFQSDFLEHFVDQVIRGKSLKLQVVVGMH